MGTVAIPDLGQHCSSPDCGQLDFLPFRCDACQEVFCSEHRKYSDHSCPKSHTKADVNFVLLCPLCAKSVKIVPGQDHDTTIGHHIQSSACDHSNYDKVHKKPRCPVPNCRQTLTFSNRVRCKDCYVDVCLRHRFAADHKCTKAKPVVAGPAPVKSLGVKFVEGLARRGAQFCGQEESKGMQGGLKGGAKNEAGAGGGRDVQAH